jgi:hypothetical protein
MDVNWNKPAKDCLTVDFRVDGDKSKKNKIPGWLNSFQNSSRMIVPCGKFATG